MHTTGGAVFFFIPIAAQEKGIAGSAEHGGCFFEFLRNVDLLRTLLQAGSATDAAGSALFLRHGIVNQFTIKLPSAGLDLIVDRKIARNIHSGRAWRAIAAGGTGNRAGLAVGSQSFGNRFSFRIGQRLEWRKSLQVVRHLVGCGHAGKHAEHIRQRSDIAQSS